MDKVALERFLRQKRKLSNSTTLKTIRNILYLERNNALNTNSFETFIYQFIEKNQLNWYNKLLQAYGHYLAFIGVDATLPPQQTPTKKIKPVYSTNEIESLLKVAKSGYRECLAISAHTGCRIGESRLLTAPQINLANNCITFFATKTKSERVVPIAETLLPILEEYIKGKQGKLFDFSDTALNDELKRCCKQLGIVYHPPSSLRNAFVTRQAGKDLFGTMNIVGHTNPKTTLGYWVSNIDALRKTIDSDILNVENMPKEKKLQLLGKHLQDLRETLKLDKDFEVELVQKGDEVVLKVKKKTLDKKAIK